MGIVYNHKGAYIRESTCMREASSQPTRKVSTPQNVLFLTQLGLKIKHRGRKN